MATRRFCDICDKALVPDDDAPLVRVLEYIPIAWGPEEDERLTRPQAFAYVAITNEQNHPLTDVCIGCKLKIVTDGHPAPKVAPIATLQPQVASDSSIETPFFRLAEKPPTLSPRTPPTPPAPIAKFEPSLPAHHLPAQQGDQEQQQQQ